jgi:hypothetical protein
MTGALLIWAVFVLYTGLTASDWAGGVGNDRTIYVEAARRWLASGSFYLDRQLNGPYPIQVGDVLYPPTALWLLVPLSFLPTIIWWAVPFAVTVGLIAKWRPSVAVWPLMAACLVWPPALQQFVTGNPGIWVVAAVAAGLEWGWPSAFVFLKPSVFPFAFIGIRRRSWWITVALLGILSLPMIGMFPAWLHAVLDGRGWGGFLYSVRDVPLLMVPVFAWAGRSTGHRPDPRNAHVNG